MNSRAPARQAPLFAICYDLSCAHERRRVDRLLTGFGFRVQKSVFECRLTPSACSRLEHDLRSLSLATGHVRIYHVHALAEHHVIGQHQNVPDGNHAYVLNLGED